MDIIAIVKLSINQQSISDDPGATKKLLSESKNIEMTIEKLKLYRAKDVVKEIEGQAIQVKSGLYENLISGRIIEVTEVKQRGKILYPQFF